ncbi:late competence development ComFB family protein [Coleofasciculus sp. FACHB-129]|uniref:late competence development ComFB family protein n=1 Tax=Cyanophyceae TaxID=3028117 RepID=UPI001687D61D|nr:late competence development ComFB family protein [Coleofasciculus sp. FACHB-129]MBD1893652.1 late competence development ComFB family protein [Coleofasciculus sp. FACHB-129]
MQPNQVLTYCNVMELLVAQEVHRQLQQLPPKLVNYINPAHAIAYALNRLPALYATSPRGWYLQQQRAKAKLAPQIIVAVGQALAAVQQDSLNVVNSLPCAENAENLEESASDADVEDAKSPVSLSWVRSLFGLGGIHKADSQRSR